MYFAVGCDVVNIYLRAGEGSENFNICQVAVRKITSQKEEKEPILQGF